VSERTGRTATPAEADVARLLAIEVAGHMDGFSQIRFAAGIMRS